ncbi:hypothetical protein Bpfe_006216 [Biomphalaria pfeifferi]|uniref:Uncharacterized protein n=1 Tax=Biomphalaria pfeifferi TaxID=112525 RepID=A0AAD8C134_BIOPF|nr:hypothetical protein Bpfe_006216 [Biomphalaria pfeifferi]
MAMSTSTSSSITSTSEATGSTATVMNNASEDISFSKRLKLSETVFDIPKCDNSERTILDLDLLINFVAQFACPQCFGNIKAHVNKNKSKGLVKCIEVVFQECDFLNIFYTSHTDNK